MRQTFNAIKWTLVVFVGLTAARFAYDTRYSWMSSRTETGGTTATVALGGSGDIVWQQTSNNQVTMSNARYLKLIGREKKLLGIDRAPKVSPPLDHPPLAFIAGASVWHIYYTTHEYMQASDCGGWTDRDKHEVWLDVEDREVRDTVAHELMHVAREIERETTGSGESLGTDTDNDENSFVTPAAPYYRRIMRDNPAMVEWLVRK